MSTTTATPTRLDRETLAQAYDGSFYTICGAGGDTSEWTNGIQGVLEERGIATGPLTWFQTTGGEVNRYARSRRGGQIKETDEFPDDITILMFELSNVKPGHLAIFRLQAQDRWFDDIIDNMRLA